MYLTALGSGGIKPCVSSFGGDQFRETSARERCGPAVVSAAVAAVRRMVEKRYKYVTAEGTQQRRYKEAQVYESTAV
jgi:hypothetical protein